MTISLRGHRATRVLAPLAVAGTAAVLALVPTSAAFAQTPAGVPTAAYAGDGVGYNNVFNGRAAGTTLLKIEGGDTVEVFCIQQPAEVAKNNTYTGRTWATSGVKNVDRAADIAARHSSLGTKLANAQAENTAAQLAIWKLTDGIDFAAVPNAEIVARATELVEKAGSMAEAPASFVLTAAASVTGTGADAKDTIVARLTTAAGAPLSGQTVKVTVGEQTQTVKTDTAGEAAVTVDAPDTAAQATVTFTGSLPAGAVLAPAAGQAMILAQGAAVTRTTTTALPPAPAPVPTAEPTPTATPAPEPTTAPTPAPTAAPTVADAPVTTAADAEPTQLPYTGTWVSLWMVLAAAVVAGGGFFARRHLRNR